MALKKYPASIHSNPSKSVSELLLNSRNVTSGPAIKALPTYLKEEILKLAQFYGMPGDNFAEAVYWVIHDLRDYPKYCVECKINPVQFRSYAEAYMYERCSTNCSNSSKTVKDLKEKTAIEKYGVPYHFASVDFKKKNRDTNLKRYGVENNMQRPDVFNKNMEAQYRKKPFTLPSGNIVKLMGYEPQAITWLLNNGYHESDFAFDNIPSIQYTMKEKQNWYHPDAFLPKENTIIEVKSTWTFKVDFDVNQAKIAATLDAGYSHWLMIFDKKGNLLNEQLKEV